MCGTELRALEGFDYSFSVPYISCEIDLLKIDCNKTAIDIEMKSEPVPEDEITKQLRRLRNYIGAVADVVHSFTVVKDGNTFRVYMYDGNSLCASSLRSLAVCLNRMANPLCERYADLFKPSDYLVSPLNSPERFLNQKYILTQQQEDIKKQVIKSLTADTRSVLAISGSAGTGKTLLLYDIAREISKSVKVCIVHCGKNAEGHVYLQEHWENVTFPYIAKLHWYTDQIDEAEYIFVDEAHRLFPETFECLQKTTKHVKGIVYSYDSEQVLSQSEKEFDASGKIVRLLTKPTYCLSGKIRTNPEVASFLRHMVLLHPSNHKHDYSNITILTAESIEESKCIIQYYTDTKNYQFINLTPSLYTTSVLDNYDSYPSSHDVIGQEFDNVLVVMDDAFRYGDGRLACREHPNPNYLYSKLLLQAISRTRIRLCIVVRNNKDLFEQLLKIKNGVFT